MGTIKGDIANIFPFGTFSQIDTAAVFAGAIIVDETVARCTVSCVDLRSRRHIHAAAGDCFILGDCTVDVTAAACRIDAAAVCSCSILGDCTVNVTFACGYIDTAAVNSGILIDHTIYGAGTPCHIDAATVIVISFVFGNIAVDITYTSGHMYAAALSKGVVVTDLCSFLDGTGTVLDIHTAVSGVVVIDVVSADGTAAAKHADCAAVIDAAAGNAGVAADAAAAVFYHHSAGGFPGDGGIVRDGYGAAGDVAGAAIDTNAHFIIGVCVALDYGVLAGYIACSAIHRDGSIDFAAVNVQYARGRNHACITASENRYRSIDGAAIYRCRTSGTSKNISPNVTTINIKFIQNADVAVDPAAIIDIKLAPCTDTATVHLHIA